MPTPNSRSFSDAIPLIVIVTVLPQSHGAAQLVVASVAAFAVMAFIPVVADLAWTPLLKKVGFWGTSLLLGFALVAACLAPAVSGIGPGGPGSIRSVLLGAAISGLLYSWVLAAMKGAEDASIPDPSPEAAPIRSRLFRGRRRSLP